MSCRVCGSEKSEYVPTRRMSLCEICLADTPAKVSREEFEREYWDGQPEEVPSGVRISFWQDYLTSTCGSVAEYKRETTW